MAVGLGKLRRLKCRAALLGTLRISILLIALPCTLATAGAQSAVVPDGTTDTTASTNGTGKVTVKIAPANRASISHNRFDSFNVPKPGVDLNNQRARAVTIINEVNYWDGDHKEASIHDFST